MKGTRLATLCLVALGLAMGLIPVWPSTAAAQKVEATLASVNSAAYINPRMQMLFIQKVAEKTNGELAIKWVGSGQLGGHEGEPRGGHRREPRDVRGEQRQPRARSTPNTMLFDFPFIFRDYDHMKKVVRGPIGQQVYSELEQKTGIKLIMTGLPDGARSIWNRRRPVLSPDDVKGLKLRVMEAPLMVDTFQGAGRHPDADVLDRGLHGRQAGGHRRRRVGRRFGIIEQKSYETAKYYSADQALRHARLGRHEREVVQRTQARVPEGDHGGGRGGPGLVRQGVRCG